MSAQLIEWFADPPLPPMLPGSAIIVGGTALLPEFLRLAALEGEGSLVIATPFFESDQVALPELWASLRHEQLDLNIVTGAESHARRAKETLDQYPWRSLLITVHRRLHGKVYALSGRKQNIGLIGSHNLTAGGFRRNEEAGVLFVGTEGPALGVVIAATRWVEELAADGVRAYDSRAWLGNTH